MSYTFGKPKPSPPYTSAGTIPPGREDCVLSLLTRVRVVVRVPADQAKIGAEIDPGFEPDLRKAIAEALVGTDSNGFLVEYAAVEQFEDAGG